MFFEVDKTNWAHRDSAVRNLEIYIQKHQMCITLEKNKDSPESSEIPWDKGTNVIFFSALEVAYHEGEIG